LSSRHDLKPVWVTEKPEGGVGMVRMPENSLRTEVSGGFAYICIL